MSDKKENGIVGGLIKDKKIKLKWSYISIILAVLLSISLYFNFNINNTSKMPKEEFIK